MIIMIIMKKNKKNSWFKFYLEYASIGPPGRGGAWGGIFVEVFGVFGAVLDRGFKSTPVCPLELEI